MNSHSMAAIKINPETLEQEGTITMPGTKTPLLCAIVLIAKSRANKWLDKHTFLPCVERFPILKQDKSKGFCPPLELPIAFYMALDTSCRLS